MRKCSMEGCNKKHKAHGYCAMHDRRYRLHGDPNYTSVVRHYGCLIEGCTNEHRCKGYCEYHYEHSPERVARKKEREQSPQRKAYMKRRNKSQAAKEQVRKYDESEKGRAVRKAYRRSPQGRLSQQVSRGKRTAAAANGNLTKEQWAARITELDYKCAYCQVQLLTVEDGVSEYHPHYLTMDHIVPLIRDGKQLGEHTLTNVVPACRTHNSSKNEKNVWQWLQEHNLTPTEKVKRILKAATKTKDKRTAY